MPSDNDPDKIRTSLGRVDPAEPHPSVISFPASQHSYSKISRYRIRLIGRLVHPPVQHSVDPPTASLSANDDRLSSRPTAAEGRLGLLWTSVQLAHAATAVLDGRQETDPRLVSQLGLP